MKRLYAFLILLVALSIQSFAELPDDFDASRSISLNGRWKFKLVRPDQTDIQKAFYKPDYDVSDWDTILVPSNWETQGFEEPRYASPTHTVGLYRTEFTIPQDWNRDLQRILLQFDGVLFGYEFWINGQWAGNFESAFQQAQFNITNHIHRDKKNTLAVRVYKDHPGVPFDCHDDWALSGIFRDVTLFPLHVNHIEDLAITTTVDKNLNKATVSGQVIPARFDRLPNEPFQSDITLITTVELYNLQGKRIKKTSHKQIGATKFDRPDIVPFKFRVNKPELWSAESPNLYSLTVTFTQNGRRLQTVNRRFGIRQVSIDGDVLKINHRPVKLRGVCRHASDPYLGKALREYQWRTDLELMKKANINTVRTSHGNPHPRFLELCDELGMYVLCEVPFGHGDKNLYNPGHLGRLLNRAYHTLKPHKNHPCIIGWTIGNENPCTPFTAHLCEYVKKFDPTRPIMLPKSPEHREGIPKCVDIYAPHYDSAQEMHEMGISHIAKRPVIYTEYSHAFGHAFGGLEKKWDAIEKYPNLAGGTIWHWCDQGLLRFVNGRDVINSRKTPFALKGKPSALSGDFWIDDNTIIDSHGYYGTDGIVNADRSPQTDYWQTRRVYSPAIIDQTQITVIPGAQKIKFTIHNRYDFTNLNKIKAQWQLLQNGRRIDNGTLKIKLAPHKSKTLILKLDIPNTINRDDDILKLCFTDHHARKIDEHIIHLIPKSGKINFTKQMGKSLIDPVKRFDASDPATQNNTTLQIKLDGAQCTLLLPNAENPARFVIRTNDNKSITLCENFVLRAGRNPTIAERRTYSDSGKKEYPFWEPYLLSNPTLISRSVEKKNDRSVITCCYEFARHDKPAEKILADIILEAFPQGWVDLYYQLTPQNTSDYLLELGFGLVLPESFNTFTWLGDGPYPSYPDKKRLAQHGRYSITPDDTYFEGNRAHIDWASLTDKQDNGIGLIAIDADMHCEKSKNRISITHNALVSGLGTKFYLPETRFPADKIHHACGAFRIVPLNQNHHPCPFE